MDILLFGTMGQIGPVAQESLLSRGLEAVRVDFPQNLFRDYAGYRRRLLAVLCELEPAVIIPVGHPLSMSRLLPELGERYSIAVETEDKVSLLDSKVRFRALAQKLGLNVPTCYTMEELRHPDAPAPDTLVFKRDVSFGGHGVHRPRNIESLKNLIAHQPAGEDYLIQDYILGTDYSVDAIRTADDFRAGCYRAVDAKGNGPAIKRETCTFQELEEAARMVMDHLDYIGVCGFDFRVSADGTPYILECNPRMTGGLKTQIDSGLDLPYLIYKAFVKAL